MNTASFMKYFGSTQFVELLAPSSPKYAAVGSATSLRSAQPLQSLIAYGCSLSPCGYAASPFTGNACALERLSGLKQFDFQIFQI